MQPPERCISVPKTEGRMSKTFLRNPSAKEEGGILSFSVNPKTTNIPTSVFEMTFAMKKINFRPQKGGVGVGGTVPHKGDILAKFK